MSLSDRSRSANSLGRRSNKATSLRNKSIQDRLGRTESVPTLPRHTRATAKVLAESEANEAATAGPSPEIPEGVISLATEAADNDVVKDAASETIVNAEEAAAAEFAVTNVESLGPVDDEPSAAELKAEADEALDQIALNLDEQIQLQKNLTGQFSNLNARLQVVERARSAQGACEDIREQAAAALNSTESVARRVNVIENSLSTRIKVETEARMEQLQTNVIESLKTSVDGMMAGHLADFPSSDMMLKQRAQIESLTEAVEVCNRNIETMSRQLTSLLENAGNGAEMHRRLSPVPRGTRDRRSTSYRHRDQRDQYFDDDREDDYRSRRSEDGGRYEGRSSRKGSRNQSRYRDHSPDDFGLGPSVRHLDELRSTNRSFNDAISYRRYRLSHTDSSTGIMVSTTIGQYERLLAHHLGDRKFTGNNPIEVLEFLTSFKELCDDNNISEGTAISLLPKFLDGNAKSNWKSYFNRGSSRLGGFRTYPEAVNHLLRTYAKDTYIEKAVADLDKTRQGSEEDELAFGTRLRDKARACGNVFSESELISKFLRGVRPDIKPILLAAQLDGEMPFDDFVERAFAQGEAHRALVKTIGLRGKPRGPELRKPVLAVEHQAVRFNPSANVIPDRADGDAIMAALPGGGYISDDSERSRATTYDDIVPGESRFELDNVDLIRDRQRRPQRPSFVGRHRGSSTMPSQPGYLHYQDTEDDICFKCFGVGHKKPNCPHVGKSEHDTVYRKMQENNFNALHPLQKQWLADVGKLPRFERSALRTGPPKIKDLPPIAKDMASANMAQEKN